MKKKGYHRFLMFCLVTAFLAVWIPMNIHASVPQHINYQGELTDDVGNPLNGVYSMRFSLYDDEGSGTQLWSEEQDVTVTNGIFSIQLGSVTSFSGNEFDTADLFLEIEVLVSGSDWDTLKPRQRITSTAFSMKAQRADDADTLDGKDSSEFAESGHTHTFSDLTDVADDKQIPDAITRDSELATHAADPSAHHIRYADTEAVNAMGPNDKSNPLNHDRYTNTEAVNAMGTKGDTNPLHHNRYTNIEAFAAVLAADGADSGLDADLLDGQHASEIIDAASFEVRTAISSLPFTISTPGSYYVGGNLAVTGTSDNGITVNADNVTIDLMGFTITGPGSGTGSGIRMYNRKNVEIRNGAVQGFGNNGISESGSTGQSHRILGVRVLLNGSAGIYLSGTNHLITHCTSAENGSNGIFANYGSTVTHNIIYKNSNSGLYANEGSLVMHNTSYDNEGYGIHATNGCTVVENTVYQNNLVGILVDTGCTVKNNTVRDNNQTDHAAYAGISVSSDNQVKGNTVTANLQNNIKVAGTGNTLENNLITASTNGIHFGDANNFIADNRVFANTSDYAGSIPSVPIPILSVPFTIASPGYYFLKGDLTMSGSGTAIEIDADNVTLDLKGFSLFGNINASLGILIMQDQKNVEIKNGTVRDFSSNGIVVSGTSLCYDIRIIALRCISNGSSGFNLLDAEGCLVKDCFVAENGGRGMLVGPYSTIIGNIARGNAWDGISTRNGSTVFNNTACYNGWDGIDLSGNSLVDGNTAYNNDQEEIGASDISDCTQCSFGTNYPQMP